MIKLENINKTNLKIIFAGAVLVVATYVFTKNQTTSFINVNGTCNQKIEKDLFSLSIDIENIGKNSVDAINKSTATYKKIASKLKQISNKENENINTVQNGIANKQNIIGIETTNYTIREKEEYNKNLSKYTKVGMKSNISLKITFANTETLVNVLDILKDFNDVRINNFNSFASKTKKQNAVLKCIDKAIENAELKAKKFAYATNRKVGKIIETTIKNGFSFRGPEDLFENMMMKATSIDSDDIFTGTEDTNLNINVKFELK